MSGLSQLSCPGTSEAYNWTPVKFIEPVLFDLPMLKFHQWNVCEVLFWNLAMNALYKWKVCGAVKCQAGSSKAGGRVGEREGE